MRAAATANAAVANTAAEETAGKRRPSERRHTQARGGGGTDQTRGGRGRSRDGEWQHKAVEGMAATGGGDVGTKEQGGREERGQSTSGRRTHRVETGRHAQVSAGVQAAQTGRVASRIEDPEGPVGQLVRSSRHRDSKRGRGETNARWETAGGANPHTHNTRSAQLGSTTHTRGRQGARGTVAALGARRR